MYIYKSKLMVLIVRKKDAEETGKLESSDRLNLEEDSAGLCGAAAGIGSESQKPVQSQQSETQNCQENN